MRDEPERYVFAAPPVNSVAIQGDAKRFPVRRIYCVGRNYAEHIREMGLTNGKAHSSSRSRRCHRFGPPRFEPAIAQHKRLRERERCLAEVQPIQPAAVSGISGGTTRSLGA